MGAIHIFIARSRRFEAKGNKVLFHKSAQPYYSGSYDPTPEDPAFPRKNALIHVVAVDTTGPGWDGFVKSPATSVDLKALMDRWVAKSPALFGRKISLKDLKFAWHDSADFGGDMMEALAGNKDQVEFRECDWGRLIEWEHVLLRIMRSHAHFDSLENLLEAQKMVGGLWLKPATPLWKPDLVYNENYVHGRRDRMADLTDSVIDEILPIFNTLAEARSPVPKTSNARALTEDNFRARKRIPASLIGTMDISDFAIVSTDRALDVIKVDPRALEGDNIFVPTGKTVNFRLKGRLLSGDVYESGYVFDDGRIFLRCRHYISCRDIPSLLRSPDSASELYGVTTLSDFLDRIIAAAVSPLGVWEILKKSDSRKFACRDRYRYGVTSNSSVAPKIQGAGYEILKITSNKPERGICFNLDLLVGEGWDRVVIPAGFVRLLADENGVDLDCDFPGFTRCHSLTDELFLDFVSSFGKSIGEWLSPAGRRRLLTKGLSVAKGCKVNDLVKRNGRFKRTAKDVRYMNDEDAAAYF